ncbi:hypothetical protein B0J11DRAFT_514115 [Dendryphion nanum]|uniref:NmrA-like domain-containing protein n=1 Tax=Dendryphion nanum TaxID=256645 RepID=A0A9P9EIY6_9PLEO|nr:hypothetical protein B0J11DRAFT_514115 [Dendryphion nanum]
MLVLVTGITGNIGQHLIESLTSRGHQVRGLSRDSSKLSHEQVEKLESFVKIENYYDIPAIERGVNGVDAVICAYTGIPITTVDAQLILLRAAERANVKRFIASSWAYDWRATTLGAHDGYDAHLAFESTATLTSTIKPNWIFSGALAEVLFSFPGRVNFTPQHNGAWDLAKNSIDIWGTGNEKLYWTSERDAAEFAAAIVGREGAEEGGYWTVTSGVHSLREMALIYEQVRGTKITLNERGTVGELRSAAFEAKKKGNRKVFWEYIGFFYYLYMIDGTWKMGELQNKELGVRGTTLEEYLKEHPEI